jgi:hypothetical protein
VDTGDYLVTMTVGGQRYSQPLRVVRVGPAGTVVNERGQVMRR